MNPFVDAAFLSSLDESDWLTIVAVAAGEQYRNQLRVKRGKTGFFGAGIWHGRDPVYRFTDYGYHRIERECGWR